MKLFMQRILATLFVLTAWATAPLFAADDFAAGKPNILLVLSDDHSAPLVGCYGDPNVSTPNLDRFASEGMIFRRAYVTCPQCVPSRGSIFSGRSPIRIGMSRFSAAFPANLKSFPEYLRETGYFVGVAGRTYHMEGRDGKGDPVRQVNGSKTYHRFADRLDYANEVKIEPGPEYNAACLNQFSDFLDQVPAEKPFFLQLCFSDPHREYDGKEIPNPRDPDQLVLPSWMPDIPSLRRDLADYYDEVNRFDEAFGKVLAELEKRKLKESTLVIFMGDNGGALLRGKGSLYEYGIHVPLIVRWSGKAAPGTVSEELISGEDIGPTCLAASGIATPGDWTGQSFMPILQGQKDASVRKYIFAERGPHVGLPYKTSGAFDLSRTIVGKRYKLIYNALWQLQYNPVGLAATQLWKDVGEAARNGKVPASLVPLYTGEVRSIFELYDLENDPDELENLATKPEFNKIKRELQQELTEWMILEHDILPLPVQPQQQRKK